MLSFHRVYCSVRVIQPSFSRSSPMSKPVTRSSGQPLYPALDDPDRRSGPRGRGRQEDVLAAVSQRVWGGRTRRTPSPSGVPSSPEQAESPLQFVTPPLLSPPPLAPPLFPSPTSPSIRTLPRRARLMPRSLERWPLLAKSTLPIVNRGRWSLARLHHWRAGQS